MNLIIDKYMSLCNTRTLFKFYLSIYLKHSITVKKLT
jgi:hypothetical protein